MKTRRTGPHSQPSDVEFSDEIRAHIALEADRLMAEGMAPDRARAEAHRRFGNVATVTERYFESRRMLWLVQLRQDAIYAGRALRRSPGFALVVTATFALGIGLCSMLLSFLEAAVLRPLPGVQEPRQLLGVQAPVSYPDVEEFRKLDSVASAVAAFVGPVTFSISSGSTGLPPERLAGHIVSLDYFSTLGMAPLVGRLFDPAIDRADAPPTAVISESFWRTRLSQDPGVVGRALYVNGAETVVIGVTPDGFSGVFPTPSADVFLPITARAAAPELAGDVLTRATSPVFRVVFRLAPGETATHAADVLTAQTRRLDERYGRRPLGAPERPALQLLPAGGVFPVPRELRLAIIVFYGLLVLALLSLTCANLAGLALARGDARRREIAIRLSLGASRARLVRQLLTESVILALIGGAAGLAAAHGLLAVLARLIARGGVLTLFVPDLRGMLLTFLLSALSGLAFGLSPAIAATRADLARDLTGSSKIPPRWRRRFGLRNVFAVYQMTVSTGLALVIGILVAGIQRSAAYNPGIEAGRLHLFSIDLARDGHSSTEARALFGEVRERLSTLHGVDAVSFTEAAPFASQLSTISVAVLGDAADQTAVQSVATKKIGPAYFATLGLPLLRGVEFDERDFLSEVSGREIVPVVINHTAATELFGAADPLGRLVREDHKVLQVVGVARYGIPAPPRSDPVPTILLPFTAEDLVPGPVDATSVVVRGDAGFNPSLLARELGRYEARAHMFNRRTMKESLARRERGTQYAVALYSILGIFAVGLASIGIAGVTAQAVVGRRKEIGVRLALGGRVAHILRLVMKEGMVLVMLGVPGGLAIGYGIARLLASINDQAAQAIESGLSSPVQVLRAPLLLIAIAALACYLPARMTSCVDPLVVLKED